MATRKTASSASSSTPAAGPARPAARPRRRLDLVLFGATGFTGRQAVRALLRQRPDAHWGIAGRDLGRLQALAAAQVPAGARAPQLIVADARDARSLQALARRTQVLFNLAGPYHATGDAVVAACIAAGTHYLDLSGETFWMQRLVREQHEAARAARVKIIPCAGYEALPFDLATLWAARQLREHAGEACASVRIALRFTGPLMRPQDLVSGGTAATVTELLAHDDTDCVRDMACLLPPDAPDAAGTARRNALHWLPRHDAELGAVLGPTLPAPFINPPVVLRGVALRNDPTLFSAGFRYTEGSDMASLLPGARHLPEALSLPLQWAAAAALVAPVAALGASIAGPLRLQRRLLGPLLARLAPRRGSGPREKALDALGYGLEVFARGERGARFRGRVIAEGHPGYRSTPQMAVCAALGLADGTLGRNGLDGVVSPAAGLGPEAIEAMAAAGLRFTPGP
ncbi:MAG TPA: saccharopine dehydrogenase NADP-binding domain-containing protein [Rubrivivax sp.]|nr:saccharopine dehydrogenase NADP-binding domain-containing protein [Rubrivivax sp.]